MGPQFSPRLRSTDTAFEADISRVTVLQMVLQPEGLRIQIHRSAKPIGVAILDRCAAATLAAKLHQLATAPPLSVTEDHQLAEALNQPIRYDPSRAEVRWGPALGAQLRLTGLHQISGCGLPEAVLRPLAEWLAEAVKDMAS